MSAMSPLEARTAAALPANPHALPVDAVAEALGVDPTAGLTAGEVGRRAAEAGPNELEPQRRESIARLVIGAATEPFVLLLMAAAVGAIALGEIRDGLLILGGLLPIVVADVATEYRGERALEALREASAPVARVRRGAEVLDIAAAALVPGDVVLLQAGDVVPADLRLARADRLQLDTSALTGESVPELAHVAPVAADVPLGERRSMAFAGSAVVAGRGEGIVVAIAAGTEVGRIAAGIGRRQRRRSAVQYELDRLVRILLIVAVGLIAIVTGLGFARGQSLGANLLAGISAAIAAIPEEPPILLAVTLGLGAMRLLRRGVLVRRLNAEEVLGAIDLIVTDKTGTLTINQLEVASVSDADGPIADPDRLRQLLELALRAEEDAWQRHSGAVPGAFGGALERAVEAAGGVSALDPGQFLEGEPPSDRRPWSTTRLRTPDGELELALGAPEQVLALVGEPAGAWQGALDTRAAAGERVLALASRRPATGAWQALALVGFADPLRPGIAEALAEATAAGIQTVVVTGDHPATAAAIASAAGLERGGIFTGAAIAAWDDARLARELPNLHVVARSTPEQKERIVRAARIDGRIVAVTGDGVNDAPALHGADVAVAMGSGTAVAKEAADLVLGDDSFVTLMYGLREGRRIVDNVQKGLVFLVSTHVAFLGFILIATLAGFGQPLLPIQILWMELFIDVAASFGFEREPAEPDVMRRPPRTAGAPLLSAGILARIALAGSFTAVAALWLMVGHDGTGDHARWLAYSALVCGQVVRAFANRSLRTSVFRIGPNAVLIAGALAVVAIQLAIPFIPGVAQAFRATPLALDDWLIVAVVALAPAVVAEVVRRAGHGVWVA
jgi:Ca2+-transporting ATPase